MKIAILSYWCLDSSFPLAKHLADIGNSVDFYALLPVQANGYVLNYSNFNLHSGFVSSDIQSKVLNNRMENYLKNVKLYTYLFNRFTRRKFYEIIWEAFILARFINKKEYDVVHVIGHDLPLYFVHRFLRNKNVFHTLHEVTNHNDIGLSFYQKLLLHYLIKNSRLMLIFNSEVSRKRFLDYENYLYKCKRNSNDRIKTIYFGLYETYLTAIPNIKEIKRSNCDFVILFYGRLVPYKGVEFLLDAFKKINKKHTNLQLIVAGGGEPYFIIENDLKNFIFINKHLSDSEIVELHQNSDLIICPYTSASQSGIVMTSFLFNKPIIASKVGAFEEVIENMKTGVLVPPSDVNALIEAILLLSNNKELYAEMVENIKNKFNDPGSEFLWTNIARKTEDFYKINK
jgi:glycosyltransferase involved in cell wall biosynthesis